MYVVTFHRLLGDCYLLDRSRAPTGAVLMMAFVGLAILMGLLALCIGFICIEDRI